MKPFATRFESPLGPMVLVSDGTALTGLYFDGQKHFPADTSGWRWDATAAPFPRVTHQLAVYFAGRRLAFDLPLAPAGTAFQLRVWRQLAAIPHGATCTYSDVAIAMGSPAAVRAVGAAVGRNPLSILVPCHRVLGRGGALTGYAGGLERKAALLGLEGAGKS